MQGRAEIRNFSSSVKQYFMRERSERASFERVLVRMALFFYVTVATLISSDEKITCYFHV